jgi:hypothetical protein
VGSSTCARQRELLAIPLPFLQIGAYRIEFELLPEMYVLLESSACKKYQAGRRIQSSGYNQQRTRMAPQRRSHIRRMKSRAVQSTKARTTLLWLAIIPGRSGILLTEITADAVRPVRTERFAVINLIRGQ